jgi:hypothetical protein
MPGRFLHGLLNALLAAWMEHLRRKAVASVDRVSDRRLAEFGIVPKHVRAITRELTSDLVADILGDTSEAEARSDATPAGRTQRACKSARYALCGNIR